MARKKLTPTQEAYNKEYNRIMRFTRDAGKRGYQFDMKAIIPKKLTRPVKASVERLKKFTPAELYKHAVYGGEATYGEIVKGTEGRKAENTARSLKSAQTRRERKQQIQAPMPTAGFTVPDNVMQESSWFDKSVIGEYKRSLKYLPTLAYTLITEWVDRVVAEIGEHLVALMLEDGIRNGVILQHEDAYEEEKIQAYITEMENYFWMPTDRKAEITDALDSNENFNAY